MEKENGSLVLTDEDLWFSQALNEQAARDAVRLTALTMAATFRGEPAGTSLAFVMKVIGHMAAEKLGKVGMETVRIGSRYYVDITGDAAFERQRLVPFRGFYERLKAEELRRGKYPTDVTPEDLRAVACETRPEGGAR